MFFSIGQTWVMVVIGGIGIAGALFLLANHVATDARDRGLRGGAILYWPLVFFVAPVGLLLWVALTKPHLDPHDAFQRLAVVAIFNVAYAGVFAGAAAAGWYP